MGCGWFGSLVWGEVEKSRKMTVVVGMRWFQEMTRCPGKSLIGGPETRVRGERLTSQFCARKLDVSVFQASAVQPSLKRP